MTILQYATESQKSFFEKLPNNQFILCKLVIDGTKSKPKKLPCDPQGNAIDPHEKSNHLPLETAREYVSSSSGKLLLGFVLTEDDPYCVVDIDRQRDVSNGYCTKLANEFFKSFQGAGIEVSISGTGYHIFCTYKKELLGDRVNKFNNGACEFYCDKRFFVMGFDQMGDPSLDCTEPLMQLVPLRNNQMDDIQLIESGPCEEWSGPVDDVELLGKLINSNGSAAAQFGGKSTPAQIWNADLQSLSKHFPSYGDNRPCDWSAVDYALFSTLAFFTGRDINRMVRLYKKSPLASARGDKATRQDYLLRTANAAAKACQNVYGQSSDKTALSESALPHPDMTQDEIALSLGRLYWNENARFIEEHNCWYFWNESRLLKSGKLENKTKVRKHLRDSIAHHKLPNNMQKRLLDASKIHEIEKLLQSNPGLSISSSELDNAPDLLGVPSGVVDLITGVFRKTTIDELITKSTVCDPAAAGARSELWESFLSTIMSGDREMIDYLQKISGYAATGWTSEHQMFFAYGSGRNGKGTWLNTLHYILGDYSKFAASRTFLEQRTIDHSAELAVLDGARFVRTAEISVGKVWNDGLLKQLTGGDPVTARLMRQNPTTFTPQFTLVIDANNIPVLRGVDEAIRRRLRIIPFNVTIPKEQVDPLLCERLKSEAPAILRWVIDGALKWQNEGLMPPQKVLEASSIYLDEEDLLTQFIEECMITDPNGRITNQTFLQYFTNYLIKRNQKPCTSRTLGVELHKRGYKSHKSNGKMVYLGLTLSPSLTMV